MLLPAGVRVGLASTSDLLPYIGPSTYITRFRRRTSCLNQLLPSRQHHISHHGLIHPRAIFHPSWTRSLQPQNRRWNRSLRAAQTALRTGKSTRTPGNQPETSRGSGGETVPETMTSGSSKVSQLQNEISREAMLKANYYKAVHAHSDIFWMTGKELSGVPGSIATRWISKPADSGNPRRYGLSRQNVNFKQVAGYVSDHDVRKKLVTWEQDTCKDLAQSFKEMVVSRATIARLAGFKSYFHCRSQSKMMTTRSVELFLKDLKSRLDPPLSAFMEQIFEQKAKDLKPDFSIRELRNSLKYYGNTIRDFQNSHPATQINWGDVTYYEILKLKSASKSENAKYYEYFSLESTVRKLLSFFGDLFGMDFREIFPDDKQYQSAVRLYLQDANVKEREARLGVFSVHDIGFVAKPLGYLVLDLEERDGKPRGALCRTFANYPYVNGVGKAPGVAILASFPRPTSKQPTLMSHTGVQTFTHELGHAIHQFVRGDFTGVPMDLIEIPSITLENWVHLPFVLQQISCHYTYLNPDYLRAWKDSHSSSKVLPPQPPQQAPLEMFSYIAYKRHPKNELDSIQQLLWETVFDFTIHTSSEKDLKSMDLGMKCSQILDEWTGIRTAPNEKGHQEENNEYLHWSMLDTYDTSAYCYLVAKVYSYDLWETRFRKDPFSKKQGYRYRKLVLEHRDARTSNDPNQNLFTYLAGKLFGQPRTSMDALTKFLGRKPNNKAFIRALKAPASKNQTFWGRVAVRMGMAKPF